MEKKTGRKQSTAQPQPQTGLFGWAFGDKDYIVKSVAALAVIVYLGLLVVLCCGVPSVAAVTAAALIAGVSKILHDMLRTR